MDLIPVNDDSGVVEGDTETEDPAFPFPAHRQAALMQERNQLLDHARTRLNAHPVACLNMVGAVSSALLADQCQLEPSSFNAWKFRAERNGVAMTDCPRVKTSVKGEVRMVDFTLTASQPPLDECAISLVPMKAASTPEQARAVPCWLYAVKYVDGAPPEV